ncbi:tRNA pseudouridine(13) synthase TruD [Helicobacter monodelphidis]|uniref:tRNA pseudouridine(13) synthase TruD n=1 Tax=Helicobacter sp. 15-1451 TaxID=2004995 RepID=UPI000DCCEACE|nr:tRNA pseudouridine(13) synthase TruD [Helicobacter sp. 15-1451]RAX57606.1 tRNA pseudouridine(13) synthase TruD [Helicobacter sp. 15-1451]
MNERLRIMQHAPLQFYFNPCPRDFIVNEIPLYEASQSGEHLYILIRKKNLSTFELIKILSNTLGVKSFEIGYAGLKDKNALTTQAITLPKKILPLLEKFEHPQIKLLSIQYHHNKIRIGHLKGNRFCMRLKKILPGEANRLESVLQKLKHSGIPNYFGYQRFGKNQDNYILAKKILQGEAKMRDKKKREFLFSALQSHLFNQWLNKRIQLSLLLQEFKPKDIAHLYPQIHLESLYKQPHFFKILQGDILTHYPFGQFFEAVDLMQESLRFLKQDITPTGLICGKKTKYSTQEAAFFEEQFLEPLLQEEGTRRQAWVFLSDIEFIYFPQEAQGELHFSLPKGAYATTFLEQLSNQQEFPKCDD